MKITEQYNEERNLTSAEFEILKFIWKWQVSNGPLILRYGCKDQMPGTVTNRIKRLERWGFITSRPASAAPSSIFAIEGYGNSKVESEMGEIHSGQRCRGRAHEYHLVQALCLGNSLLMKDCQIDVLTERELRTCLNEDLPEAVRFNREHFPKAIMMIGDSDSDRRLIAVECEIKSRSESYLQETFKFYQSHPQVEKIFWVIGDLSILHKFAKASAAIPEVAEKINFLLPDDLINQVWQSRVILGVDSGRSVQEILGSRFKEVLETPEVSTFGIKPQEYLRETLLGRSKNFQSIRGPNSTALVMSTLYKPLLINSKVSACNMPVISLSQGCNKMEALEEICRNDDSKTITKSDV